MSLYSHCMKNDKHYLLHEWDTEKNTPLTPQMIACTSTTVVWWKCEKNHSWQTQLSSRVRRASGCPLCLREKIDKRVDKRRTAAIKKKTPYLLKEPEK